MHWFLNSIIGDRGHLWQDSFNCPYMLCPSNDVNDATVRSKKTKMKFVQKISPRVYQYRCLNCGCLINKGSDGPAVPEEMWAQHINPRFVRKEHSYNLRKWS